MRVGKTVDFTTSSQTTRHYSGVITSLNAVPTQGTLSYRARIVEPNPDLSLRGGMLVSVVASKDVHRNALVVPRAAVFSEDAGAKIFLVSKGPDGAPIAHAVPVSIGLTTDTESEIIAAGVQPGNKVITTRADALQNGSPIAIVAH